MALTNDALVDRRGPLNTRNQFGYPVAAGEKIYRGGLIALNSSGYLVRIQTSGALIFAGLADRTLDNSASGSPSSDQVQALKGTWKLAVSGASYANIGAQVFASDDSTLGLAGALAGVFALGGSDTGTGVPPATGGGALTISAGAKIGVYTGTVLSGATTFSFVDPNGDALATGTIGSAYSAGGVAYTVSNVSGHNFVAGDTWTVTVSESTGEMLVGRLAGIDAGATYVDLGN